jgi:hypothetical protein
MTTEFEFAARLIFWGDALDTKGLAQTLQLTADTSKAKGQPIKRPDGTDTGSAAKTGMLICELGSQADLRRDPEAQLVLALNALRRLTGAIGKTYGAEQAQLQISVYYRAKVNGEADFVFPAGLLELLVTHGIGLSITVLP